MFVKIPFESTIEFKTNISEITKMSLEHDYNISEGIVLGNFYISGEYRPHEVSINTEPFKYTLPFTVELREDILEDTLEFNIEDFAYEVVDKKNLKVNIEYSLKALVKENDILDDFERVNEDELNSELEFIDEFLNQKEIDDNKDEVKDIEEENINKEDERKDEDEEKTDETNEVKEDLDFEEVIDDERIGESEKKTIMETIKNSDDTFVTYHIHIVKESESLETIASMYNVPSSIISEYNDFDSVSIGDKVLIPKIDE